MSDMEPATCSGDHLPRVPEGPHGGHSGVGIGRMSVGLYSFLITTSILAGVAQAALAPPFDTPPSTVDAVGPSAGSEGGFPITVGSSGSLILDFDTPFTYGDGDNEDFAILTSSLGWGPADHGQALFQFFLGDKLIGSLVASLVPDQLFTFDLPEGVVIADRVVVTNVSTPDTGMTFSDAGVVARDVLRVAFDLKPQDCPNRIDRNREGGLPAAILGTADFDVTEIDPESVILEGTGSMSPRFNYKDVATPRRDPLDCARKRKDGFADLALEFDNAAVGRAIAPRGVTVLKVRGSLHDGTVIIGEDVAVGRN